MRVTAVGIGAGALDSRWAALAARWPPELAVSAGVCGGLDPHLAPGTLVVPERVLAPDGEVLMVSPALRRLVLDRVEAAIPVGSLVTSRAVLATPAAKAGLRAQTGAGAVDMESAAILRRAAAAGIASLVVRAVSDAADEAVPAALGRLVAPDGRVRVAQAVAAVVTSPAVLRDALRLRRSTQRALGAVGAALWVLAGAAA
jgi:adenosylhomocysteine nucleosidase